MKKPILAALSAALLTVVLAEPAAAQVGPDAAACRPGSGQTALVVTVRGFQRQTGTIRLQLHGSNPSEWLDHDHYLKRIQLPVNAPAIPICVRLPGPGRYAIAVRHDMDGDGHMTMHDGGGYSRNPHLSITHYRPSYGESAINIGQGIGHITIVMNYLYGLSIHPVGG